MFMASLMIISGCGSGGGGIPHIYIALAVVVRSAGVGYKYKVHERVLGPRSLDLKPLKAPKMVELPELTGATYRNPMLWGSYRSGLYFGMRTRSGQGELVGHAELGHFS